MDKQRNDKRDTSRFFVRQSDKYRIICFVAVIIILIVLICALCIYCKRCPVRWMYLMRRARRSASGGRNEETRA